MGIFSVTDKLQELIVYVASKTDDDHGFGDTHLNKVLFFSDAFALQRLGKTITHAPYRKHPNGPTCRALLPARKELVAEGAVDLVDTGSWKYTVALREPELGSFSKDEIALVDEMIALFHGKSADEVSKLSHQMSPGWNLAVGTEDIPLETQFIASPDTIPDAALERGSELAARFGW